jgi:hypothetical protein
VRPRRHWALLCGPSTSPLDRMRSFRILLAFCFSPLVPALMVGLYFVLTAPAIGPPMRLSRLVDPSLIKIAYAVALIGGMPAFLVMRRTRRERWWHYAIGGALLGCLPGVALAIQDLSSGFDIIAVAIGAPYGALSGFLFWLLGIYRNRFQHAV